MNRLSVTTRGFWLLLMLVVTFVIAQWGDPQLELIWRATVLVFGILTIFEWLNHQTVVITATITSDLQTTLGAYARMTLQVESNRSVPFKCFLVGSGNMEITRQRQDDRTLYFEVRPHRLGEQAVGTLFVRTPGIFGLTAWDTELRLDQVVHVKPDRNVLGTRLNGKNVKARHADKITGQSFELDRLKDYQVGDSVRYIDWKATAKRRKKTVRTFTDDNQQEVCILLDASHYGRIDVDGLSRFTHMLNTTAVLSSLALASGDRLSFCAYGSTTKSLIAPGKSHTQHQQILQGLTGIELDEGPANHLTGYMHISRYLKRRSLLVFLTHLDHASQTDHLAQTIALAGQKHLVMTVSMLDTDLPRLMSAPPKHWQDPFRALAASQVEDATTELIGKLRRGGAHVIHTRQSLVDQALITSYQRLRDRRLVS